MGEPKGAIIIPIGYNPSDDIRAITVDANDYLHAVLETGLSGGGVGEPKGPLVTLCGFNPDGVLRSVELDANDNLLITLLGGSVNQIIKSDGTDAEWDDLVDIINALNLQASARAYKNSDTTLTSGDWTAVACNKERYDTDSIHDLVTNNSRLTCKTAGKYCISGTVLTGVPTAAVGSFRVRIKLNGSTYIAQSMQPITHTAKPLGITITTDYDLSVNDYLELFVHQDSGGNMTLRYSHALSPEFMMHRFAD